MTRTDHLISILSEECSEVSQRCSKALRFGLEEVRPGQALNNADMILRELADLTGVYEMLVERGDLPEVPLDQWRAMVDDKKERIEHFLAYSRKCGRLSIS